MPLRRAQRWLASVILEPDKLVEPGFGREAEGVLVTPSAGADAVVERLRAYTGGYPARICEALAEAYPALEHVIGASAFHDLSRRYLAHVPGGIRNLNDVGKLLPSFLADDALVADFPFAPDLARLESAIHVAFHAREVSPLDPATLSDWTLEDWSAAVLRFQPSVALVRSEWPIRDIWAARETPIEEIDIAVEGRPDRVLVYRTGYQVMCEWIEEDEAVALAAMLAGATLGDTAEQLAEGGGDAEAVARWFARWSGSGLIAGCSRA